MKTLKLFYATNRKHLGENRWKPDGYGIDPSSDGHENLRFGQVEVKADESEIKSHLNRVKHRQKGDGVELSKYLTSRSAKSSSIKAYEDFSFTNEDGLAFEENASFSFFSDLKQDMLKGKDVLVYIHGFNVSWDEAVGGALALELALNENLKSSTKEIVVVLFSWPSNGRLVKNAAYKSDRSDARYSGRAVGRALLKLGDFLEYLTDKAKHREEELCNMKMHLLCHSMGNYVLENAVKSKLIGYSNGNRLPRIFDQILLCAADVEDTVLEKGKGLARLHEMARQLSVYFNDGDLAMHIGKYTKTMKERLGHTGMARPSLVHNKIHQIDCTPIVRGLVEHSYYLWGHVNLDIAQNIEGLSLDHESRKRKNLGQSREWKMK